MEGLERFLEAQDSRNSGYETAIREIKAGCKVSHWIWYIFPQMRGLGHSGFSHKYGISSLLEAKAYLEHPVLGARLREVVLAMTAHAGSKTADDVLGSTDAMKLRSCLTLFDAVSPQDIFSEALVCLYEGTRCGMTLDMIAGEQENYIGRTALERVRGTSLQERGIFEMDSEDGLHYSMMCRTTFLLDCVLKGESMRRMVQRYLWDRDLSADICESVMRTLKECLKYSVCNNRSLHKDGTLYRAALSVAESVTADNVLEMADRFDSYMKGMMSNPVTRSAMETFVESY